MEIITFNSLPSTNNYLMELSKKDANSWTVIHAINQTNGKGYSGNVWETMPNLNLTFSFLLKSELNYKDLIHLNEWVAYCIFLQLSKYSTGVEIKWPNDIIINNKKNCGVLIENFRKDNQMNSVIGIGINVNQTDFNQFNKATSLAKETNKSYDILSVLNDLMNTFQENYFFIEEELFDEIHDLYNKHLFRRNVISKFIVEDKEVDGTIISCTKFGTLLVNIAGEEKEFIHKQIEFIY